MLRKLDSCFGHLTEDSPLGEVYQDDKTLVRDCLRSCKGCNAKIDHGAQDPCIAGLPNVINACCGHGLDKTPYGNPNGYVAFEDGRTIYFSGTTGGERIRALVDTVLRGDELPEGFQFSTPGWWTGLSPAQRDWVHNHIPESLLALVQTHATPSPDFLNGTAMWHDGLNDEQKSTIWAAIPASIEDLVNQAKLAA